MWMWVRILRHDGQSGRKSCCIRIGPQRNVHCADINSSSGQIIPWIAEIGYICIYIGVYKGICILEIARIGLNNWCRISC